MNKYLLIIRISPAKVYIGNDMNQLGNRALDALFGYDNWPSIEESTAIKAKLIAELKLELKDKPVVELLPIEELYSDLPHYENS